MIRSQALLQRERGVAGTALPDVLRHSGAPRGSIYHHFPNGRAQLAAQATEWAANWVADELERSLAESDIERALQSFIDKWAVILRESDFAAGCPVTAGALDANDDSGAREAAAEGFRRWEDLIREAFIRNGLTEEKAEALALTFISATEGAIVLARAEGSLRPIERVAEQLRALSSRELAEAAR
ncbi:MAG: TetR/AcrR family transcriptional regulator [Thermoleophilaceae bacterium]|nr:TetR/AcrR family transcriptional regulator [Thermoleophilaceae bacterium]